MPGIEPFPARIGEDEFPWSLERTIRGEALIIHGLEDLPEEAIREKEWARRTGVKAALAVPLMVGGSLVSILALNVLRHERNWPSEMVPRLRLLGKVFINAKERKRGEEELQKAFSELESRMLKLGIRREK
jgi:hypothetical protein